MKSINQRLLALMARSLYPQEPVLAPGDQAAVEEVVVNYLADQIAAMPLYLRLPYVMALHVFNYSAVFRFGLPFTRIQPARQARFIGMWSHSPIGLMRDFVKLIRSCVLLAYLDHPLVLKGLDDSMRRSPAASPS
jgi:hypothetical protein